MKNTPLAPISLPKKVRAYLDILIKKVNQMTDGRLVSVLLFGSYVKGHPDPEKSDLDVVLVLDDKVHLSEINRVDRMVEGLEITYGFSKSPKARLERLFRAIERATGMFASHFICKKSDILKGDFRRVFSVSRIFEKFLAPSRLVFSAILSHAVTIYGDDISEEITRPLVDIRQWLRSLSMCFLLSLSGLLASFLNKKAIRFMEEAIKWSLLNTYYYVYGHSPSFQNVIRFYSEKGLRLAKELLSASGEFNVISAAKSPLKVIRIHVDGLKLLRNSSSQKNSLVEK
ncbi:MAG: nucleotidyltransferase domain-containing protein [Candidatus Hodarchaeota archaeon]